MGESQSLGGETIGLGYHLSIIPELSNPIDPNSVPTGNTCFIMNHVYESETGVADPFQQTMSGWEDFPEFGRWLENCEVQSVTWTPIK